MPTCATGSSCSPPRRTTTGRAPRRSAPRWYASAGRPTTCAPFAIALAESDPLSGVVVLSRMRRLPVAVGAERLGMLTGASMMRVAAALKTLFDL